MMKLVIRGDGNHLKVVVWQSPNNFIIWSKLGRIKNMFWCCSILCDISRNYFPMIYQLTFSRAISIPSLVFGSTCPFEEKVSNNEKPYPSSLCHPSSDNQALWWNSNAISFLSSLKMENKATIKFYSLKGARNGRLYL